LRKFIFRNSPSSDTDPIEFLRLVYIDAVVAACALTQDLAIMPHGDKTGESVADRVGLSLSNQFTSAHTEIGERGISLSGGQKARYVQFR
jgi:ABC-type transport system involved in cytochrome bd biosynthesis fused ATPase/permease subunit